MKILKKSNGMFEDKNNRYMFGCGYTVGPFGGCGCDYDVYGTDDGGCGCDD